MRHKSCDLILIADSPANRQKGKKAISQWHPLANARLYSIPTFQIFGTKPERHPLFIKAALCQIWSFQVIETVSLVYLYNKLMPCRCTCEFVHSNLATRKMCDSYLGNKKQFQFNYSMYMEQYCINSRIKKITSIITPVHTGASDENMAEGGVYGQHIILQSRWIWADVDL